MVGVFLIATATLWWSRSSADAQITLDALQRDGYGMVPIKRPEPNVLTVIAMVNGKKALLVVDTGWGADGITLDSGFAGALRLPTEAVKEGGRSASGAEFKGMTKAVAAQVLVGNVEMKQVPLFFESFKSLQNEKIRRSVGADGFLGAGFLRTCSAVVDLHNLRVYLRPPGTGHRAVIGPALQAAGLSEVSFTQTPGHDCLVEIEINDAAGYMFIDTGATLAGVDERFIPKMKAAAMNTRTGSIDAAGVISRTKLTRVRSFKIGGVNVRAHDLRVGKFGFYPSSGGKVIGLLGMDILGPNGTIIDFSRHKLYFYKAG